VNMIKKLTINNFKTLKHLELECSNLNLLTGLNGMGKSSVIQALLLLRQSHQRGMLQTRGLTLKGDLVNIGTGKDAFYEFDIDKEVISFGIKMQKTEAERKWEFAYSLNEEVEGENIERKFDTSDVLPFLPTADRPTISDDESLFGNAFQYLHANRFVQNEYPRSEYHAVQNKSVGMNGEYAAHFLEHYGEKVKVPLALWHDKDKEIKKENQDKYETLAFQVNAWMGEISPSTSVIAEAIKGVDSVRLRYTFGRNAYSSETVSPEGPLSLETSEFTPLNVGFGITYSLSVIVALLAARPGDLIIIENPEAHLHPRGQSMLGRLMARAAGMGAQLFIESHSDHVLNGIRVAVNQGVGADAVRINYFQRNEPDHSTTVDHPIMHQDGSVEYWPLGFFDQMNYDFDQL